jgi:N-acetylglucosaminyldiphosphoundecaprenol N-acetyl-beta-D-mannosaminyltransferase
MSALEGTRADVLGAVLDPLTTRDVVARCVAAVEDDQRLNIGVVNAAKIVKMRSDPLLRQSVLDCDLVLADGQAVVWAARLLGHRVPERIAGIDLFLELLAEAARRNQRVYFLGARRQVLDAVLDEVARQFPGLVVAGARDGYFSDEEAGDVAKEIAETRADMLFLGITSPKKEIFIGQWGKVTEAKVIHGVGGSFDILAGQTKRAPRAWQRAGLEWLYRLLQEPVRLGPRYLTTNTKFLAMLARERISRTNRARRTS